jgi:hypothetical protein
MRQFPTEIVDRLAEESLRRMLKDAEELERVMFGRVLSPRERSEIAAMFDVEAEDDDE